MAEPPAARPARPRDEAGDVEAIVLAAGRGERLGLGPKALLRLGDLTLLERAIRVMRSVARRVIVGVPAECLERLQAAHGDQAVFIAGGETRMATQSQLVAACRAPLVVVHDVVHPFVTADLTRRVVAAALATGAAMAVTGVTEHVYRGGARLAERVVAPDGLWLARKPIAASLTALVRATDRRSAGDEDTSMLLIRSGQPVEGVPTESWNIKITTAEDWKLAEALDRLLASGTLGGS